MLSPTLPSRLFSSKVKSFHPEAGGTVVIKSVRRRRGIRVLTITVSADDSATARPLEGIIKSANEFYSYNYWPKAQLK